MSKNQGDGMARTTRRNRPAVLRLILVQAFVAAALAVMFTAAQRALAAGFTPGNLVVYRTGSGSGSLLNTGNPVFLDEYTPAGALVQSIPLPTASSGANRRLIASGTATS